MDRTYIFKAFSSSIRLRIFELLLEKRMCVSKIVEKLNVTQPTVTQHLKILQSIGLVKSKKIGYWVHYYIDTHGLNHIRRELQKFVATLQTENKKCKNDHNGCSEYEKLEKIH